MEAAVLWGYKVTVADVIAVGALLASILAIAVSVIALRQNRNLLSLYQGNDYEGVKLYVTNNSPHAVTVLDMGFVRPSGRRRSLLDEDYFKRRIDPRDEIIIGLNDNMTGIIRRSKGQYSRYSLYVALATGEKFYTVSRTRLLYWWFLGWIDGSRRAGF
ncbi:MAG: hypothetical protein ABS977_02210 [Pseudomonas qingdaonensis]|uniref:hypothetical protein n=1 Tax=Pseudomonas qingdaonensis TaxID=2056231 RepID=UPI001E2BB4D9